MEVCESERTNKLNVDFVSVHMNQLATSQEVISNKNMLYNMFGNRKKLNEKDFAFNYGSYKIVKLLYDSWLKQMRCDVTIKTLDKEIGAQRLILSAFSPKMAAFFASCEPCYICVNTSSEIVAMVLNFLYTCDIQLNCRSIPDILCCAQELDLQIVVCACSDFLTKTVDGKNFILHFSIATNNCLEARHDLKRFMVDTFSHIRKHPHFHMLPFDHLHVILRDQDLKVDVFMILETIFAWIGHDHVTRKKHLADFIDASPTCHLDMEKLKSIITKYEWLQADHESMILLKHGKYKSLN